MDKRVRSLCESIITVQSSREFECWVRGKLRRYLPHAALLMTLGKLYGAGSMPTHRIGVDYPLSLVEGVKTDTGAIDDPLAVSFLRNEKLQFVNIEKWVQKHGKHGWCSNLQVFGIESVLVHGALDHQKRRFAILQIVNPSSEDVGDISWLVKEIVGAVVEAAWRTVDLRVRAPSREVHGHPTASLSETELKIVQFLALGLSNKEIARRRGVSDSTIKTQVSRTGAKLGATRRSEIVAVGLSMLAPLPAQGTVDYDE